MNIEEIEKEINNIKITNCMTIYGFQNIVLEILDKYKDKEAGYNKFRKIMYKMAISYKNVKEEDIENMPSYMELLKYKNAWEEIKNAVIGEDIDGNDLYYKDDGIMQELEQKHNIKKEMK